MSIPTKKLTILLLFILSGIAAVAQGTTGTPEKKKGRPNIPGTFQLDLGFNFPSEKAGFNTSFFGSTAVNIYYFYDMRLGKSKFSIHPGIGFGLERYKFNNNKTLGYNAAQDTVFMVPSQFSNLRKTKLITNYPDIPLEVRFSTRPDDPNRSFKISLGFKVGVLFDSYTKQKYSDDGEKKKEKNKQNFNLFPVRFGPYFRVGGGNLSVFGYYSISPLFKNGGFGQQEGTDPGSPENINNFVIGISLATF